MSYAEVLEGSTGVTKLFLLEHLVLGYELWVLDWKILDHKKELTKQDKEEYFTHSVGCATFQYPIDEMIEHPIDVSEKDGISEKNLDDVMAYIEEYFPNWVNKKRLRDTMRRFFNVNAIASSMINSERSIKINTEILGNEYDPQEEYTEEMEEKYVYPAFEKAEDFLEEIHKKSVVQLKRRIQMKRAQVMSFECMRVLDENE